MSVKEGPAVELSVEIDMFGACKFDISLSSVPCRVLPRYDTVFWEAFMPGPIVCSTCDKPEHQCVCDRYCTICKGQHKVRLCADGLYYCPDCREACDVALANTNTSD
jgi:hypothetical protein